MLTTTVEIPWFIWFWITRDSRHVTSKVTFCLSHCLRVQISFLHPSLRRFTNSPKLVFSPHLLDPFKILLEILLVVTKLSTKETSRDLCWGTLCLIFFSMSKSSRHKVCCTRWAIMPSSIAKSHGRVLCSATAQNLVKLLSSSEHLNLLILLIQFSLKLSSSLSFNNYFFSNFISLFGENQLLFDQIHAFLW